MPGSYRPHPQASTGSAEALRIRAGGNDLPPAGTDLKPGRLAAHALGSPASARPHPLGKAACPAPSSVVYVIHLDRYHLDDPLFPNRLARGLAGVRAPKLLVHGAAAHGERLLEAEGGVAVWQDGVLVAGSEGEHAVVERAAREVNRRIAHALNEAGVPAVRLDGASRGLLVLDEGGRVHVRQGAWLARLVEQQAVPVVAALAAVPGGPIRQVNAGAVAAALALFLGGAVLFLAREQVDAAASRRLDPLSAGALPEAEPLQAALGSDAPVLLIDPQRLHEAEVAAVRVRP